ncbi:MAG: DUF3341 domain-containing protein [Cyanobacteria bacterium REEB65]|nr:DUF3341 domain-containing protein [Cyanobacteria bacterium REEB65]
MADVYVIGAFKEADTAAQGIKKLLDANFPTGDIDVLTGVPYPPEVWGLPAPKSNLRKIAAIFWILGACSGFTLTSGTGWLFPLPTAAKAIISVPAYGIITYEFAMLFGMFGTAIFTLIETRLPNLKKLPYHNKVTEGWPAVTVRCPDGRNVDSAESLLKTAGAQEVLRHA